MGAGDEDLLSIQSLHQLFKPNLSLYFFPEQVSQNVSQILVAGLAIPLLNHMGIHAPDVFKWPVTEVDYSCVVYM